MKAFAAKIGNTVLTKLAQRLALTGCFFACHAPEAPEELF